MSIRRALNKYGSHLWIFQKGRCTNGIHRRFASSDSKDSDLFNRDKDPSLAWEKSGKVYDNGPDQILPSTTHFTWHADGAVKFSKLGDPEWNKIKPISVPTLLQNTTNRVPDRLALSVKRNGEWVKWTYTDYLTDVRTVAKAFIALGLERFHSVCILGFNSPEWLISDLAAIYAGGFAAGIYQTNSSQACAYVASDSKANIFIVDDETQLRKVLKRKHELPHLRAIVQYLGEPHEPGVYSWKTLMKVGSMQPDSILDERLRQIAVNQCCTLIYTSGTTGHPKGVMLSHDNVTWLGQTSTRYLSPDGEHVVSFLPLSHVASQMADIYSALTCGGSVHCADTAALRGTLVDTMREVNPTKFVTVPRVYEKFYERLQEIGSETKGLKKAIATWAKNQGFEYNMKLMNGHPDPSTFQFKLADKIVLSQIRKALGLHKCDLNLSGAAPISMDILKYFMSLNLLVTEAYGMSETSGPHSMGLPDAFRLGSVGRGLDGVATKIDKPDETGQGEVCMGGRHIFMGYINRPDKTIAAIDKEGWIHSEDLGKLDEDGYLFITGRLKDLIITAGGENVAPTIIEDNIKVALPIISQAMVIGDQRRFLSVLLTIKTDVDLDTQEPLDTLLPVVKEWITRRTGLKLNTLQEFISELYEKRNSLLIGVIDAGIDEANSNAISQAQEVQKWYILPKDFSIPGGEIGPTLKLKRNVVHKKYKPIIDKLYDV